MASKDVRQATGIGRIVGSFALGAAAGSLLGILFAPASGQATRKRLRAKAQEWQRSVAQLRQEATKKLSSAREWMLHRVSHQSSNGRRLARPHQPTHHV